MPHGAFPNQDDLRGRLNAPDASFLEDNNKGDFDACNDSFNRSPSVSSKDFDPYKRLDDSYKAHAIEADSSRDDIILFLNGLAPVKNEGVDPYADLAYDYI